MRFPFISALIAGAALAQVGATPIRLLIVTSSSQESDIETIDNRVVRLGHAVPHINPPPPPTALPSFAPAGSGAHPRRPCHARLRQKSVELSNLFRKMFGLPLIHPKGISTSTSAPVEHEYRILPFVGTPPAILVDRPDQHHQQEEGGEHHRHQHEEEGGEHHRHHHHHHHHHGGHKHGKGKKSFMTRLHFALMALGPWEGRAVAFVLGCGIGVLLRMMWVLALVSYRLVKGPKQEANRYTEVIVIEPYEDRNEAAVAPPPTYTFPDEKADSKVADVTTADAPAEEAK